ncbi:MAG: hypothetical protein ACKO2G_15120 [Verrucomicrobiales bacterium]
MSPEENSFSDRRIAQPTREKKPFYPITDMFRDYLSGHDRLSEIDISYDELHGFSAAYPLLDEQGVDTLWRSVVYDGTRQADLHRRLCNVYASIRTDGDLSVMEHLYVERVDFCEFGNSQPFRVRIVNHQNDNYDHFYVKRADASRVFGLELEHLLSPNRIGYLVHGQTLIEEHIAGVPGDIFIDRYFKRRSLNRVRIAKEFVKFNERCIVRLLGDMRCYNYVVDITPDFEDEQYRVRAIDFDQQTYEGDLDTYLPHHFENNQPVVDLCRQFLSSRSIHQYQMEERTLMARRYRLSHSRLKHLFTCMKEHPYSSSEKIARLGRELDAYHGTDKFSRCRTMGDILETHLEVALAVPLRRSRMARPRDAGRARATDD